MVHFIITPVVNFIKLQLILTVKILIRTLNQPPAIYFHINVKVNRLRHGQF